MTERKLEPWSDKIWSGAPSKEMTERIALAVSSDVRV